MSFTKNVKTEMKCDTKKIAELLKQGFTEYGQKNKAQVCGSMMASIAKGTGHSCPSASL